MTRRLFIAACLASSLFCPSAWPQLADAPVKLPTIALGVGNVYRIDAEVAHNMAQRAQGLMFRPKLGENEGMLFVYTEKDLHAMWMKNTLLPLSVAFIDERGVIINIEEMAPMTTDTHAAQAPAAYSLEMNGGWFAKRRIKPGAKILGLERAPKPQ
jgi:uncharacterized protein